MRGNPAKVSGDRIADPWGRRTPYGRGGQWPVRTGTCLAEEVAEGGVEAWVRAASLLHSDGDAMDIAVRDGRIVGVRGRAATASTGAGWSRRICTRGRRTARRTG